MKRYPLIALLGLLMIVEALSFAVYANPSLRPYGFILIIGAIIVAGWKRPVVYAYALVMELLIGGKGYLFFLSLGDQTISIRYALFIIAAIAAFRAYLHQRPAWRAIWSYSRWPMILLGWVLLTSAWGVLQGYPLTRVYLDMNAYLFLLAWPIVYVLARHDDIRDRLWLFVGSAAIMVALKSWILVVVFGQQHEWLTTVYRWVRNTGVGEIVPINKDIMRVFMQSQVFGALAVWLWIDSWRQRTARPIMTATAAASIFLIIVSLSRSFWVGAGVGFITYLVISIRDWRSWWRLWPVAMSVGLALVAYSWAVNFPGVLPGQGDSAIRSAVSARFKSSASADASTARQNQIAPLMSEIKKNPVVGRGFGAEARYYSTDPRVKGWRTTSAFELGWLDAWLKFGLVGVSIFVVWLWQLARRAPPAQRGWIVPSLFALVVIHAFTPYLNHPLGLGWLLLLSWPRHE